MPAQQHAHGLAAALAAAARVYLRKPSRLRREGALGVCLGRCVRHALVAVFGSFSQRWVAVDSRATDGSGEPEGGESRQWKWNGMEWEKPYMYFIRTSNASVPPGAP
jgi:hypothetical protein